MDLNRFLEQRRPRWNRLAELLDRVERHKQGVAALSPTQAQELYRLYRLTSSDLNLAQTRTGNPAVLDALEGLVGRAYAVLSVPTRPRPLRTWWRIMRHRFPAAVRRERNLLALATLILLAGALFGTAVTALAPGTEAVFLNNGVGRAHLQQTPAQRVRELEQEQAEGGWVTMASNTVFSSMLFTHNIRVTVFAFALGLTFGIGTAIVLFSTGTMLGSLGWLYWRDGVFMFFIAWIGPHGVLELPSVLVGCTAGFMLARAQWRVEGGSTWTQIRRERGTILTLLAGGATLLVPAGIIEGGFSQITEPTLPYPLKIAVAAVIFTALIAYLFWMPVDAELAKVGTPEGVEADGSPESAGVDHD